MALQLPSVQLTSVVDEHVAPLLDALHVAHKVHITNAPLHAGEIGVELLNTIQDGEELDVVVAGGDGTAHELIEGVISAGRPIRRWNLVILPLGTVRLHIDSSEDASVHQADSRPTRSTRRARQAPVLI